MSAPDPITIFLAVMTFISTMTGVASTFVTFAQFKRESAAREAIEKQNDAVSDAATGVQSPTSPRPAKKPIPGFSFALKSKFRMSVGLIVLALILGGVWKGAASKSESGPVSTSGSVTNALADSGEESSVSLSNSRDFAGGQLHVSLNIVDAKGEPPRYFATFTVLTEAGKSKRIKGEEAGFIMDFEGFNVRLVSVSANEANFEVKKKNAT